MENSNELIAKYYQALKELKERLEKSPSLKVSDFQKDQQLSSNFFKILVAEGVIKRKRRGSYEWNSIDPNRKMADAVLSKMRDDWEDRAEKHPRKPAPKPKAAAVYELPILWGLITFKIRKA